MTTTRVPAKATVVGGGPGGLMAAEILATAGLRVRVVDHKPSLGRKLLLAGRSGLNLTNSESVDHMLPRFAGAAPHLEASLRRFGPDDLRSWSASLGETTFVGSSGRVFPESMRATPLLRAWLRRLADLGVITETRHRWLGWALTIDGGHDPRRLLFQRADGTTIETVDDVTVFALGGASWPRVGSDGGWVDAFRRAGVSVAELRPSNCGIVCAWTPAYADRFAGVPLKNVVVGVGGHVSRGDVVVTETGMEGSPVYALSPAIRDAIDHGSCTLSVDLLPDLTLDQVATRLAKRRPKDSVSSWLRRSLRLPPIAMGLLREATENRIPDDPARLAALLKTAPIRVEQTAGIERAISSAGGISFDEVDEALMLLRYPGTFVAGEMLDWEAPTGGYLLQATFSTAVTAAEGAVAWLSHHPR